MADIHKAPALEPVGPNVLAIHPLDGHRSVLVADCSNSLHGREYARLFAASGDMLLALQEVLKTPGLQSGLQAMCAAAVAKATGQSIDEVLRANEGAHASATDAVNEARADATRSASDAYYR